ncbi:hypothetical protein COF00_23440 [Bacillus wiedmannii]|nr:hypothetical protein COF00_23440 [Bacillus wiedmannii]
MYIATVLLLAVVWCFSIISFSVYTTAYFCVDQSKGYLYNALFAGIALVLSMLAIYLYISNV